MSRAKRTHGGRPARDRRTIGERRLGPRRLHLHDVAQDRRVNPDRRKLVDRRETASGHIRNALQTLQDLVLSGSLDAETRTTLASASERLQRALSEVERLITQRTQLGEALRRLENPTDAINQRAS